MPWVVARLHGKEVFARARADGSLAIEGAGRVGVCYRDGKSKLYHANARNVVVAPGTAVLPDETCQPEGSNEKKSRPTPTSAPGGPIPDGAIVAYADGACSGNPGPAGLGIVLFDGGTRVEISEFLGPGTNNIAELTAVDRVLDEITDVARPIVVYTDSSYAIGVLARGWKAKANTALITRIRGRLEGRAHVELVYVPGHAGVALNEAADKLARAAVASRRSKRDSRPGTPAGP